MARAAKAPIPAMPPAVDPMCPEAALPPLAGIFDVVFVPPRAAALALLILPVFPVPSEQDSDNGLASFSCAIPRAEASLVGVTEVATEPSPGPVRPFVSIYFDSLLSLLILRNMNHKATRPAKRAKKPNTAMSAIAHLGTGFPLFGSLFCNTEGPLVLAIEEITLDSVDATPAFEVDRSDKEDNSDGGMELPAAERLDMIDDKDDCALETDAATAVKPARLVIVLKSPVNVSGRDPRFALLSTIEVARAGGIKPSRNVVGMGAAVAVAAATEAEDEKAAAAAS